MQVAKDVKSVVQNETTLSFTLQFYFCILLCVWFQGVVNLYLKGSKVVTWRSLGTNPASTAARVAPTKQRRMKLADFT